ncbi:hypothetical protein AAG906_014667 [Vitis piasezkii]
MSIGINIEHLVAHTHTQNALVRIQPTTYHEYSPSQLVLGKQPNVSHLRIFGCAVYVPIAPTQRTKMGPQRRLGIYVGFDSPSIIRYLEPLIGDVFTARFANCHFNESIFPSLGREKSIPEERREISWKSSTMSHLDPHTNQCELEVQMIIHLQNLANQLPDAFIDTKKVTKSHIPAKNTPARIDVHVGQLTNESKIHLKHGRPVGSKDVTLRKRRTQEKLGTLEEAIKMIDQFKIDKSIALEEAQIMQKTPEEAHIEQEALEDPHIEREAPEEAQIPENYEISKLLASKVIRNDEDPEPRNMEEFFGPVVQTLEDAKHVGYKWVFVRKCNENNEIIRYKAPGIDYEETYSPIMDAITFHFLIRFKLPKTNNTKPRSMYSIKLQRSLYGLKQSGCMWYNRLSEYLLKEGYVNNPICPCIFIKKSETGFAIIAVYVDDLNLVGTPEELTRTTNYLKKEFDMKDLGKTKFCLGLQIEHFPNGVLVH